MIGELVYVASAGTIAGLSVLGFLGLARALRAPRPGAAGPLWPAPVSYLPVPAIDPIAAVQELEDRLMKHSARRRAVVDLPGGLRMSVQRSIRADADTAWPSYKLTIDDHSQDLATWEEVVEVAEARLRAVQAHRSVRS